VKTFSKGEKAVATVWEDRRRYVINQLYNMHTKGLSPYLNLSYLEEIKGLSPSYSEMLTPLTTTTKPYKLSFHMSLKHGYYEFYCDYPWIMVERIQAGLIQYVLEEQPGYVPSHFGMHEGCKDEIREHFTHIRSEALTSINTYGLFFCHIYLTGFFLTLRYFRRYTLKDEDFPKYAILATPANFSWTQYVVEIGNL
jgi:hypothetical protein